MAHRVAVTGRESLAAVRTLEGPTGQAVRALSVGLSLYALYWVVGSIQPQVYRVTFLLLTLILSFTLYPGSGRTRHRVTLVDWALSGFATVVLLWPLVDFDRFIYRAATPTRLDVLLGVGAIGLVLEATRRTVGWVLPVTAIVFLAYARWGALLDRVGLGLVAHRGYDLGRTVGTLYMTLEGLFGVPLDVASTYIVLFTVYGAVLQETGAGRFFLDWATAALGRSGGGAGPARAVTLATLLLGAVSGSGVATTVAIGAIAWPILERAGYRPATAAAILSAGGIGALISPPMMGAAAFLVAEFLRVSYLQVMTMALVPALLYYLAVFLVIEADARRLGAVPPDLAVPPLSRLWRLAGYHFSSLVVIVLLLAWGLTPFRAVFWAILLAAALSWLRPETALGPRRLIAALDRGGRDVVAIAATTACAGVIVGVITLTGLGLKLAGVIVDLAGGSVLLTVVYAALAVWLLGLAVPVTASYIIAAVMIAPALTTVGIPAPAAHMFIFYYAVLSEVSPPTALSPVAAAALTGANPFETMLVTWKYALPAFLVPLAFTIAPDAQGLLLQGSWPRVLQAVTGAALGIAALAVAVGGWLGGPLAWPARALAMAGGLLLCGATPTAQASGTLLAGAALAVELARRRYARRRHVSSSSR